MINIVWVGNKYFAEKLRRPGVSLTCLDPPPGGHLGWPEIVSAAGPPDLLAVGDKSMPPFVLGMERFPCLTAIYAVDTHIHSWLPYYAQAFDLCLVSLKDHLPRFQGERLADDQILWSPPYYAGDPLRPEEAAAREKIWDILFVGTLNPRVNPERIAWMEAFRAQEPRLHLASGDFRLLNPQSRLILNHSIGGDLNFRVFETLGCGMPLLSPRLAHGLDELFTDGEDLFLFDQEDIPGAAALAGKLLADPERLLQTARNGHAKVLAAHLDAHRAERLLVLVRSRLESGRAAGLVAGRLKAAEVIHRDYLRLIYLHLAESLEGFPDMQRSYLAAAAKSD